MLKNIYGFIVLLTLSIMLCVTARAYAAESVNTETIVLAGGCFWCVEAVFEATEGVTAAESGYTGDDAASAHYAEVSTGRTGHAEAVKITYDPQKITLNKLLDVFFTIAHDPTELNRQGPDHGTQYRSAIFYDSPEQKKAAEEKIAALTANKAFSKPIVTTLEPLKAFYPAEENHQDFAKRNPTQPYIVIHSNPKLSKFKEKSPELFKEK